MYEYVYDVSGNLIKKVTTLSNDAKYVDDYSYDANGNLVKNVHKNSYEENYIHSHTYRFVYIPLELSEKVGEIIKPDLS